MGGTDHFILQQYKCDHYGYCGLHLLSSPLPTSNINLTDPPLKGDAVFFFFFFFGPTSMCQRLIFISFQEPPRPLTRSCGFHNTVAAWLKQRSPDRSITNLHSQQSVTDSMPTKPLAIHY